MNEIEKKFADALCRACDVLSLDGMEHEEEHCVHLCLPQHPIGIYVVDFYMEDSFRNKFVVEIDGQESHKTKLQRYEDYVRERFLQRNRIVVIRFTASEVYVNADKCAEECLKIIDDISEAIDAVVCDAYFQGRKEARQEIESTLKRN